MRCVVSESRVGRCRDSPLPSGQRHRSMPHPARYLLLPALLTAAPAAAQIERLEVRGELGVGSMLTGKQRDDLGYGLAVEASLRPGWRLTPLLAAELELGTWFFPSDPGMGRASLFGAGLHVDPPLRKNVALFFDGHFGLGLTGPHERAMFDFGAGVEMTARPGLALGP